MKAFFATALLLTSTLAAAQYRPRPLPGPRPDFGRDRTESLGTVVVRGRRASVGFERVDSCARVGGEGRVRAIKLRALNDDVNIFNVTVRFENGRVQPLFGLAGHLYARGETRWVDLPGNARCIDSVMVVAADDDDRAGRRCGGDGRRDGRRDDRRCGPRADRPARVEIIGQIGRRR